MPSIWEIAKGIEIEGMKMYESLALKSPGIELTGVFSMLAKEEQRHYDIFCEMEKNSSPEALSSLPNREAIKDIFSRMSAEFVDYDEAMKAMRDAEYGYTKALSLENRGLEYYQKWLDQVENASQKAAINSIIAEEQEHVYFIEELIAFVHRPKEWVENAEFNHREAY